MNDEGFWRFAYERQRIWYVRTMLGHSRPWTQDPILGRYRFCNVHRELDRGTQRLIGKLNEHVNDHLEVRVLNVLLMRYFNRSDVPWVESHADGVQMVRERMRRTDGQVFSGAWTSGGGTPRGMSLRDMLPDVVGSWNVTRLTAVALKWSLNHVYDELLSLRCIGPVVAWQQALDLTYVFTKLSDDEWVYDAKLLNTSRSSAPTHGPALAASRICEGTFTSVVHRLRDEQDERLARVGVRWSDVSWGAKPRLTLGDIEHTLCEYQRYVSIGAGKGRRRLL